MIVLPIAMLMAAGTPVAPSQERRALGQCLSKFVHDKLEAKLDAAAFKTAAHGACAAQETAFRTSWVSYYVAMNTKRSEAEQIAGSDIDGYIDNATESYVAGTTPASAPANRVAAVAPAPAANATPAANVTPASATTPPK